MLYNAWVTAQPIHIDAYGPTGLKKLTQDFFEYEKFDIDTRLVDEGGTDPRQSIFVHEFEKAGDVLRNGDVHVTSCRVRHPPITQSYAYRFDARDRSIVISGDTAYAPELAEFAKGADVLIHEENRSLLRECADDTCAWLFIDRTKNHSRRWCEMNTCGTRNKMREYRERQKRVAARAR